MLILFGAREGPSLRSLFSGFDPGVISFSRASARTVLGRSRTLLTKTNDVPRFAYDPLAGGLLGLLYEPQKTNLLKYSDARTNVTTGKTTVTDTGDTFLGIPNGTHFAETTLDGTHSVVADSTQLVSVVSGTTYTSSIYAKAKTEEIIQLAFSTAGFGTGLYANFNLVTGAYVKSAALLTAEAAPVGDDIFRLSITGNATATASTSPLAVGFVNGNINAGRYSSVFYVGTGKAVDIYMAQFEEGYASSYNPAAGSATTGAADALSFTIPVGVSTLRYVFDNDTTQDVAVSAGAYTVPTTLNRSIIKRITTP